MSEPEAKLGGRPPLDRSREAIVARTEARYAKGKRCSKCGEKKPLRDFYRQTSGYPKAMCADCEVEYSVRRQIRDRYGTVENISEAIIQRRRELNRLIAVRREMEKGA